ncbi:MAG: aspartyl-tRNA(Asn)/glutamyl-tRNA(Gln) amidotransferase subunit [Bacillota bacterium]|nr:Asp-tRNA(Asn)/Glu-tRNA(Gln) amidotransferase subunit GatB [Bacillota bacterium]MDK2930360.1 aspartyl-tRNA(Asn)/glutamyl-tRNA(Gln) amidotransferase subunit [Bacillota bacterium]
MPEEAKASTAWATEAAGRPGPAPDEQTGAGASEFEPVVGLEVHVELSTKSKLFCGCQAAFNAPPNSHTCPVCLGLPGVLPVLNRKAVEFGIKTALALNCEVSPFSKFDRKNYFYPDLPKNYQISQYDLPLGTSGYVDVSVDGGMRRVRIKRVHLEEDAGKSVHESGTITGSSFSLEDYNRTGVPLLEIVSEPDLRSPEEAYAYLSMLRSILRYLDVSDCKMEEGSLRCDANISVRPKGSSVLGTPIELKNLNSFRAVEKALAYEFRRQAEILARGERITRETRHWDESRQVTVLMRRKEEADDYRYFPEPDLVPLEIDEAWVNEVRSTLPELPGVRYERFMREYGLPAYDAAILTESKDLADYFEAAVSAYGGDAKAVSNWVMGELARLMNATGTDIRDVRVAPTALAAMLKMIDDGTISGKIAKTVFEEMFATGKEPRQVVAEKGLVQIADEGELARIVDEVIAENRDVADEVRAGKDRAITFLVGQVMKKTRGRANPQAVNRLLRERLSSG